MTKKFNGLHLMIDGYVHDGDSLTPHNIKYCFDKLIDALNLEYLSQPVAQLAVDRKSRINTIRDDTGWVIYATLTTSHISCHTYPRDSAFSLDLYSCKTFDHELALDIIEFELGTGSVDINRVYRDGPKQTSDR